MKKHFLLSLLFFALACEKVQEIKLPNKENEINFCALVEFSENFETKVIQTKAIVLGYHTFIFYNNQCLEQDRILALEMNYESRRKISEALNADKTNYKAEFLNNNLYAEITVLGILRENDEKQTEVFHPKHKFFVKEIKNVSILAEEIFPTIK